jgi:hypothetical protein
VPRKGLKGKSGANPARSRHCERGDAVSMATRLVQPGKVKRQGRFDHLPPSQETYLRTMTADFLRRTERMRFILGTIRRTSSTVSVLTWEACRHLTGGRQPED